MVLKYNVFLVTGVFFFKSIFMLQVHNISKLEGNRIMIFYFLYNNNKIYSAFILFIILVTCTGQELEYFYLDLGDRTVRFTWASIFVYRTSEHGHENHLLSLL